jgi:uncharacterized protein (TIRG00374 family)
VKLRWLFWLLIVGLVWLVVSRLTGLRELAQTLARGQWEWVVLAALLQVVYYLLYTAVYQAAFSAVEVPSRTRELLPVMLGSICVNVVAPTGGTAGAALFVDDAVRRGYRAPRAAAGTLLALVADFGGFTLVLIVGLGYLFSRHDLKAYEITGAAVLLLLTSTLTGVLLVGLWRPALLARLLTWVQRAVNAVGRRLRRSGVLAPDWADRNAAEFGQVAAAVRARPDRFVRPWGVAVVANLVDLASLYVLFLAFHQTIGWGRLVAGYAVGVLFWIVSPTPQGIGTVEGVMALAYASLGVPTGTATVVALSFRGLTFWLPLALGVVMLRRIRSFRKPPAQ